MADEGNAQQGGENSAESSESAHLTDMHISTYEEMKAENVAESYQSNQRWAQERLQEAQYVGWRQRDVAEQRYLNSRWARREAVRSKNDPRGRYTRNTPAHSSDVSYVKGSDSVLQQFWGKATWAFFRFLRVV
jgi:hypothetical protein